jgi:hypothetical protein
MSYVTGAQILTHVGKTSPTAEDTAWAGTCADAIEGAIAARLDSGAVTPNSAGVDELEAAARSDGAALFNSKAAPHGVLSLGIDGEAVRLGADSLRACLPVLRRIHPTAGIGIG